MFHGLFEHKCVDFEPLLELKEYFRHLYEVKQMSLVGRESGAKITELQVARRRLWNPMNKTDQDTNSRLVELVSICYAGSNQGHAKHKEMMSVEFFPFRWPSVLFLVAMGTIAIATLLQMIIVRVHWGVQHRILQ